MKNMRRVLIFDFDGVIVDSFEAVFEVFNVLCEKHQIKKFKNKEEFSELFNENVFDGIIKRGVTKEKMP